MSNSEFLNDERTKIIINIYDKFLNNVGTILKERFNRYDKERKLIFKNNEIKAFIINNLCDYIDDEASTLMQQNLEEKGGTFELAMQLAGCASEISEARKLDDKLLDLISSQNFKQFKKNDEEYNIWKEGIADPDLSDLWRWVNEINDEVWSNRTNIQHAADEFVDNTNDELLNTIDPILNVYATGYCYIIHQWFYSIMNKLNEQRKPL